VIDYKMDDMNEYRSVRCHSLVENVKTKAKKAKKRQQSATNLLDALPFTIECSHDLKVNKI
jgi:hypothetical protein